MAAFLAAYHAGDPVGVWTPVGTLVGVVGFQMRETGISFMDDGFLSTQPTNNADHHLDGTAEVVGEGLMLNGHRFVALEGDDMFRWFMGFRGRDIDEVRKAAEARLLSLRQSR